MLKRIILFGLLTIIISVIVVSAYEDKFPRVAYSPPHKGGDQTYRQYFAQAESLLHFTALIQNAPLFQDQDFNVARSYHLNLVNAGLTYYASSGQYSMYQADGYNEDDYFQPNVDGERIRLLSTKYNNAGHGRQVQDTTVHDTTIYSWFVSKDNPNDNRGYVFDNLWIETTDPTLPPGAIDYSREQDRDSGLVYNVIFRLKYPKNPTYLPTDTVAKLEVHIWKDTTHTHMILAESLLVYDTSLAGQYDTFRLTFLRPPYHPGDSFDYRVYWYKQTDLYIDYVEVYDAIYDLLFNVKACDTCSQTVLERQLINDTTIKPFEENYNGSSLYRWLLTDEPTYDQYKSSRRVSEILADSTHRKDKAYAPGIQTICDFIHRNTYRFVNEVEPHEVFYDDYPILSLVENDNDALQLRLDTFADWISKANDASRHSRFHYCRANPDLPL